MNKQSTTQEEAPGMIATLPESSPLWLSTHKYLDNYDLILLDNYVRTVKRDWLNQPRCYRRYWGCPIIMLPPIRDKKCNRRAPSMKRVSQRVVIEWESPSYNSLYDSTRQDGSIGLNLKMISSLLYFGLALSAQKEGFALSQNPRGAWTKRVNPSR